MYKSFIYAKIAFTAAFCLVLSSCGALGGLLDTDPAYAPEREDISAVVLVDSESDGTVMAAAEAFADEISVKTGGTVKLRVEKSLSVAKDFLSGMENGGAAFVFAAGGHAEEICNCVKLLSEPFLYRDYEHFTMTVNSVLVYEELEESLPNARFLAGFYTGSGFVLSRLRIDEPTNFEGISINDGSGLKYEDVPVVMMTDDDLTRAWLYSSLGADPAFVPDAGRRIQAFDGGTAVVAEFSFAESGRILARELSEEAIYLTRSFHNAEPLWLIGAEAFFSVLSKNEEALVYEAVASLFDKVDGAYLRAEDAALRELLLRAAEEAWDFSRARRRIRELMDGAASRTEREQRILKYIYSLL